MNDFGKELILDLYDCDISTFTRKSIRKYFKKLCELIDMKREKLSWWDYYGDIESYNKAPSHLKGITAVQFIKTSNITIHTLDDLNKMYINIFSCKDFDSEKAIKFTEEWFKGCKHNYKVVRRI